MVDVFGIEASRLLLLLELKKLLGHDSTYINIHHTLCLTDFMTNLGFLNSINRFGLKYQSLSALQQCSFEETVIFVFI